MVCSSESVLRLRSKSGPTFGSWVPFTHWSWEDVTRLMSASEICKDKWARSCTFKYSVTSSFSVFDGGECNISDERREFGLSEVQIFEVKIRAPWALLKHSLYLRVKMEPQWTRYVWITVGAKKKKLLWGIAEEMDFRKSGPERKDITGFILPFC